MTLIAYPLNDSNVEVPYFLDTIDVADIALTFTIQDITDVTKRRGSYSKTIKLPSTPTNDACFGHAYNVQSFVGGFTPNKRIRCALWNDGIQVFNGSLQLLSITKQNGDVTYEVGIYSEEIAFFRQINETLLCQTAGVSGWNHTLTASGVVDSWTFAGSPYVYGFIDGFGYSDAVPNAFNALVSGLVLPYVSLTPSVYVYKLIDLIFEQAGYRYQSDFFISGLFKKLVIPYAGGATIQSDLSLQNSYVDCEGLAGGLDWQAVGGGIHYGVVPIDSVISDPQGYWSIVNEDFTNVEFYTSWDVQFEFTLSNTDGDIPISAAFYDKTTGLQIGDTIFQSQIEASSTKAFVMQGSIRLQPNQEIEMRIYYVHSGEGHPITLIDTGKITMTCTEHPASIGTVDMVTALPMDITQADLLSDLQKMFNLYFYVSPEDPKLIYVEPFNDFYTSGSVDWSQKVDEYAEQVVTMGDPEMRKSITFKYRDSGDALGKLYSDSFAQGYGSRVFQTENYYAKGEQAVETKCATVIPASYGTGLVIGRTFDLNGNGTPKERPTGYRIAQYNGIGLTAPWIFIDNLNPLNFTLETTLPFISHIDNPYNPAFDLSFGMPMQLYYKAYASGSVVDYTNSNLFNNYWRNYILETTSKEAMQIELDVMLNAVDIYNLDFRKPIYYGGVLWRLLEISDYTLSQGRSKAKMRRILNLSPPSLGAVPIKNFYDVNDLTLGEMSPQFRNPTQL